MRKILLLVLTALASICICFGLVGCKDGDEKPKAQALTLNSYAVDVEVGESFNLTASLDDIALTVTDGVTFESSNASIATVTNAGVIEGVADGSALITAKYDGFRATCRVNVTEPLQAAGNFYLDGKKDVIFNGDYPLSLTPVLYFGEDLVDLSNEEITWSSSNTDVATVTDGVVSSVSLGNTVITAKITYQGKEYTATYEITVDALLIVKLDKPSVVLGSAVTVSGAQNTNKTYPITFKLVDGDGNEVEITETATYDSTNENVVTVDDDGVVTAVSEGTADVTVDYMGKQAMLTVTVGTAVSSKADLDELGTAYRDDKLALWGADKYYVLTNDIDYDGAVFTPIAASAVANGGWFVGSWSDKDWGVLNNATENQKFYGTLDGNGFSIKNAKLSATGFASNNHSYGNASTTHFSLFSNFIGVLGGTLKNICFDNLTTQTVADGNINAANGMVIDTDYMSCAGLVGFNHGTIENVLVRATVKSFGTEWGTSGILAYNQQKNAVMKNCIVIAEKDYTSSVKSSHQSPNHDSFSREFGTIIAGEYSGGTFVNVNGTFENCFSVSTSLHAVSASTSKANLEYATEQALYEANAALFGESSAFKYENGFKLK